MFSVNNTCDSSNFDLLGRSTTHIFNDESKIINCDEDFDLTAIL